MVQDESFDLHLPPYSNRGVLSASDTYLRTFLLFDWIQVTIFPFGHKMIHESLCIEDYLSNVKNIEMMNSNIRVLNDYYDLFYYFFKVPRCNVLYNEVSPQYGYQFCYSYKNIRVFGSDSCPEMGVHIQLSGAACRELEDMGITYDELFYKLKDYKAHYTRIDVSYDDYTGKYWTVSKIQNCIYNKEVVTKFRSSISIIKDDLISTNNLGHTIQFGSRSSDIQFTFYDKLKERKSKNYIINESILFWNRFETRFRNDKAQSVVDNYLYYSDNDYQYCTLNVVPDCSSFNEYIKSIINNYISFRVYNTGNKQRCRWPVQKWWQDFLDNCKKIQFQNKPIEYSITKKRLWIDRSVSYSNFCVMLADIPDLTTDKESSKYLYDLFITGSDKINEKDLQFINEYRIKHGKSVLDLKDIEDYVRSVKDIIVMKESESNN